MVALLEEALDAGALGMSSGLFTAPGSYAAFAKLSAVTEAEGVPAAEDMVRELVVAHETVAKTARSIFGAAEDGNDEVTADLLTQRMAVHEKTAWMLRSLLD